MPWYRMKDGTPMHLNFGSRGNKRAPLPCMARREDKSTCLVISAYECDWKLGGGKTCDKPICAGHAQQVGPNKHLCPDHQVAYVEWKAKRETACAS